MVRVSKIRASNNRLKTRRVRVQRCFAPRRGVSALGSSFVKGDVVVRLDSYRRTGEVFFLTTADLRFLLGARTGKYESVRSWVRRTCRREGCPVCARRKKVEPVVRCGTCGR